MSFGLLFVFYKNIFPSRKSPILFITACTITKGGNAWLWTNYAITARFGTANLHCAQLQNTNKDTARDVKVIHLTILARISITFIPAVEPALLHCYAETCSVLSRVKQSMNRLITHLSTCRVKLSSQLKCNWN